MKLRTLAATLLLPLAAAAQTTPLLDIADPANDDDGDGALIYPRDSAFAPGDLDLRALRVYPEGANLRFEAVMRNPVRDPSGVRSDSLGSEDLALFARRGFYAFNLDIYVDTDRVAGSGNTITLPGRGARIDAASAWEKAVLLTPRPELMRRQLRDALGGTTEVDAALDTTVVFPTQVRVRGRSVSFMVPKAFFGNADITNAAITVLVTAAKLSVESDFLSGLLGGNPMDRLVLGAQQPTSGSPTAAMGYTSDRVPATAVVDLLSPDPLAQARQLAAGGALQGLSHENRYGQATTPAAAAPVAAAGALPWFTRAMTAARGAGAPPGAPAAAIAVPAVVAPAPVPAALPAPTLAVPAAPAAPTPPLVAPATPAPKAAPAAAAAAPPAAPAPAKPRDAAFFEEQEQRLRTLKRLREAGLISEDEYQAKRREVLSAL